MTNNLRVSIVVLCLMLSGCGSMPGVNTGNNMEVVQEDNEDEISTSDTETQIDLSEIESLITDADNYEANEYTAESYNLYSEAITDAREAYELKNGTQDKIDELSENIKEAKDGLKLSAVGELRSISNFEPYTIYGSGEDVIDIPITGVPYIMYVTHDADGTFIVWGLNKEASPVELWINRYGESSEQIVANWLYYNDIEMVHVNAKGNWSITFLPYYLMDRACNSTEYKGNRVLYIDSEEVVTKMTLEYSGGHNFVVWKTSIDGSNAKLVANKYGECNITVPLGESRAVLIVQADPEDKWSISYDGGDIEADLIDYSKYVTGHETVENVLESDTQNEESKEELIGNGSTQDQEKELDSIENSEALNEEGTDYITVEDESFSNIDIGANVVIEGSVIGEVDSDSVLVAIGGSGGDKGSVVVKYPADKLMSLGKTIRVYGKFIGDLTYNIGQFELAGKGVEASTVETNDDLDIYGPDKAFFDTPKELPTPVLASKFVSYIGSYKGQAGGNIWVYSVDDSKVEMETIFDMYMMLIKANDLNLVQADKDLGGAKIPMIVTDGNNTEVAGLVLVFDDYSVYGLEGPGIIALTH